VWEAIGDLPPAATTLENPGGLTPYGEEPIQSSDLRRFYRRAASGGVYNHVARALGKNSLERVKEIDALTPAMLAERRSARHHYHYSYARLRWAEPARTITKFVYHVGSGMFCHPTMDRALTMREAARLQTFPDDFRFPAMNIRDLSSLIGGAVPPLLANAIARKVVQYLDSLSFASMTPSAMADLRPLKGDAVVRRMERQAWSSANIGKVSAPKQQPRSTESSDALF
jgi:DNA (cytosine-5)-methyltransferase 1